MMYQDLCQTYSDVYKDFHGVRPPSSQGMSVVELLEQIDMYQKYIEEDLAEERAIEDASINACIINGVKIGRPVYNPSVLLPAYQLNGV